MVDLYTACRALYDQAFPGESEIFTKAMFDRYYPDCLRVICEDGQPVSMLFSIPYPLITAAGERDAHYLYAVATHAAHRGKGLAKQLLLAEAARYPVFLRPMSPSLFDFYKKVGFSPLSPMETLQGDATAAAGNERHLMPAEFLRLRDALAPIPHCRPTATFLSLYQNGGGMVAAGKDTAAIYEKQGEIILFKEYWGSPDAAPRLSAFLGGSAFRLRRYTASGTPFGMGVGIPAEAAFLAALD